jgi:hypothetical protein
VSGGKPSFRRGLNVKYPRQIDDIVGYVVNRWGPVALDAAGLYCPKKPLLSLTYSVAGPVVFTGPVAFYIRCFYPLSRFINPQVLRFTRTHLVNILEEDIERTTDLDVHNRHCQALCPPFSAGCSNVAGAEPNEESWGLLF